MRWIRTAATTVTALLTAIAILWAGAWWTMAPRVNEWAVTLIDTATDDLRIDVNQTAARMAKIDGALDKLSVRMADISAAVARDLTQPWRFSRPDTTISDGPIGGLVRFEVGGFKMRECGVPRVDLYFVNGGGIYHRFTEASILTEDNRGIVLDPDPGRLQKLVFTARIPADDGVRPGRALGFISVTYPDMCPFVPEVVATNLQFRIMEDG